jgi:7-cyano-7-deazaguanine synthase in queuosine biosynthesis
MTYFEILGPDETVTQNRAEIIRWTKPTNRNNVRTDLDWHFTQLGDVSPRAADLLRIAAAAYMADRRSKRPSVRFSRDIDITVHVNEPEIWLGAPGETLVELLAWITGDEWTVRPVQADTKTASDQTTMEDPPRRDAVMLLSGGLDSFCGAVNHLTDKQSILHLGHRDSANAVIHAQDLVETWFLERKTGFAWVRHALAEGAPKLEQTTRTRSLLFMALAVAAADATGASEVIVPENGSTSMNVPLLPSRGGALSTKSTHPWTFDLTNRMINALNLKVEIRNPYLDITKGELLTLAHKTGTDGFLDASRHTLSCSKLDSRTFKGGNPNQHCGICIACLVRRGSYIGAGIDDPTSYAINTLTGKARQKLVAKRHDDLWALDVAKGIPITEDDLIASATWPEGADLAQILSVAQRGKDELLSVPRP